MQIDHAPIRNQCNTNTTPMLVRRIFIIDAGAISGRTVSPYCSRASPRPGHSSAAAFAPRSAPIRPLAGHSGIAARAPFSLSPRPRARPPPPTSDLIARAPRSRPRPPPKKYFQPAPEKSLQSGKLVYNTSMEASAAGQLPRASRPIPPAF